MYIRNNGGCFTPGYAEICYKGGDFMDYIEMILLIVFIVAMLELIKNIKK